MPKSLLEARGSSAIPMTPFDEKDNIDISSLEKEIDFICEARVGSICTPVMVSEFMTLSESERKTMIEVPIKVAAGRVPVIANVAACSIPQAVEYTKFAESMGADAIITMAPWCGDVDTLGHMEYFSAIAEATDLPVMIQNIGLPGVALSPEQILFLCEKKENISWVKEEVTPGPISIEKLNSFKSPNLTGIMSGIAGSYAPLDYYCGAIATIQACQFCDVSQKVWDLLAAGKEAEARELHYQMLPGIQAELLYGFKFDKEIMVRRGIFKNSIVRNKRAPFSAATLREIDIVWEHMKPLLVIK